MKFGIIKSLVESKLIKSFGNNTLTNDLKILNKFLKEEKNFKELMYVYDTLSEQKGLDKETATYFVEEIKSKSSGKKLSDNFLKRFKNWTKEIVTENHYENIDNFLFSDLKEIDKVAKSKKNIIESISKTKVVESKSEKNLPISSILKIANQNIQKHLETLSESERNEVIDFVKNGKDKFEFLKQQTIEKLEQMMEGSEQSLKSNLLETKNRLSNTEYSKEELTKLVKLNKGLII